MLYLIDANSIIDAKDLYYVIDRVPEFWEWLVHHGQAGRLKIPAENFEEISPGPDKKDPFYIWRKDAATAESLVLSEDADTTLVQHVLDRGYAKNLTDDELIIIGKDPFLIAYALSGKERVVVTSEKSKPKAQRKNRKIPDVCNDLGVRWITPFQLNIELDFKTNWKK
ncbi:conserved hypothetical protein [Hyphomicrobium sp. GJ21]|uniref:DUF4411 family protein n=1 Tax=Hyphomicrobium sp. GJ21 TaxID=113574 RepID=UPI000622BC58|nr:DUF4411 family protein [Hyphomicrobium sp. GJ21]CEJ86866.1 conserved hypothetical protein [Hyphomicrobium sp. GJ21]